MELIPGTVDDLFQAESRMVKGNILRTRHPPKLQSWRLGLTPGDDGWRRMMTANVIVSLHNTALVGLQYFRTRTIPGDDDNVGSAADRRNRGTFQQKWIERDLPRYSLEVWSGNLLEFRGNWTIFRLRISCSFWDLNDEPYIWDTLNKPISL